MMNSPKSNGSASISANIPSNGHIKKRSPGNSPQSEKLKNSDQTSKLRHPIVQCMGDNMLTVATIVGVVVGIVLGLVLKSVRPWTKREEMYVNFPGELFIKMLKCLILPLIVSSLISAIGVLDTRLTGKIGFRTATYFLVTTVMAIILGIILVLLIRPGSGGTVNNSGEKNETKPSLPVDALMDLVRNMIPPNIIEACIYQYSTVLKKPKNFNESINETDYKSWDWEGQMEWNMNILGIVVISVVLGITVGEMKEKGKPILDFFTCLNEATTKITGIVRGISPVAIIFLIASKILETRDLAVIAGQVGLYTATVLVGIIIHGFIVLPLIYFVMVRRNPYTFLVRISQALATAFRTSSSSATLPVTIACFEEMNHIDPRVSHFCLSIGAAVNMDGTALYEAVAAIFIAQVRGVTLSVGGIIAIGVTATAASIGAAGIPLTGLVMVLSAVGLPAEYVTLILVVDWIVDRFRTTINVLGDCYGSAIVAHYSTNDLKEFPKLEEFYLEMTT